MSRRALLHAGATAALGGAVSVVAGCRSSSGRGFTRTAATPFEGTEGNPIPGGSVTFGRLLAVLGIDPHVDLTGPDIDSLVYSYLYHWKPSTETAIFNNFALSLEMPSPDRT